ncbi:S24 family peptidase [Paraburkholderia phenoliruptrix]|uniref:S24 family peptidase n=1 Tax=Paraburkholderia phenoliruptrix TaxID=252970 RepID=UPI001C6DE805|nr:S24 family peptidase [Paraburkholderia phenoliruptrix]MBW9102916.1 S24 family peptidase [Paraburkholderia phenoliruptrix]MBW9132890.1 S24 family peptidase [Paraburkholderia ginsengiterrae]
MNELELAQQRIEALRAAIEKVSEGNRTAFGRRLGYKDGAFVRQMLSGDRPVTEKTIRAIEAIPGMRGWFSKHQLAVDEARATQSSGKHKKSGTDTSISGQKGSVLTELPGTSRHTMEKNTEPGPQTKGTFPLISWAQAGTWETIVDKFEFGDAEQWLDSPFAVSEKSYYLRVRGESNYDPADPRSFREGEIVLIDPRADPAHRKFVIVQIDGEAEPVLRQLLIEGERRYLKALNPAWPDRIVEFDDMNARICGVVRSKIVDYD